MKKVLKLAVKCVLVLLPLLGIWIYTWVNPLGYMDGEAPNYFWNKEKVTEPQDKEYQVIILGDSIANAAFMPEALSASAINLSLGGTTPVENYYVLQEWLENQTVPEACYISFTDSHLKEDGLFWERIIYTHRFTPKQCIEMLKAAQAFNETSILTDSYKTDFISYELRLPNKYISALMNSGFNQRYGENVEEEQAADLHGGRYIARGVGEDYSLDVFEFDEFYVNPIFDEYYKKIVLLCKEYDIKLHIVKPPLPYNKVYTEKYAQEYEEYYESLKELYPGLTVDRFGAYDRQYYEDTNHLNTHGALKFCNEIKALYPEDFDDSSVSEEQIAGINDLLQAENSIGEIVNWIAGKDYTLVLIDPRGRMTSIDPLTLYSYDTSNLERQLNICYLSGTDDNSEKFSVDVSEDEAFLCLEGKEPEKWCKPMEDALFAAVIDHYHNEIVCMKVFEYKDETFSLFP